MDELVKEIKPHRSVYDIKKTSAWSGPHSRPSRDIAEIADWVILVLAVVFLIAIYFGAM